MIRAVLDTNILVAALRSRNGASFALLRLVADRRLRPLVTTALFMEYEAVLKRPEQRAVHGFSLAELDMLIAELAALVEPVETHFTWRPQLADPQDELVLECAVNGRANVLVTHNVKHLASGADKFGIRLMKPGELLERVRQ